MNTAINASLWGLALSWIALVIAFWIDVAVALT